MIVRYPKPLAKVASRVFSALVGVLQRLTMAGLRIRLAWDRRQAFREQTPDSIEHGPSSLTQALDISTR
jgi:uncharacterized protein YhdP